MSIRVQSRGERKREERNPKLVQGHGGGGNVTWDGAKLWGSGRWGGMEGLLERGMYGSDPPLLAGRHIPAPFCFWRGVYGGGGWDCRL